MADRSVALHLYRALRRLARLYDEDPALKALIAVSPRHVYDPQTQSWQPLHPEKSDRRGLGQLASPRPQPTRDRSRLQ